MNAVVRQTQGPAQQSQPSPAAKDAPSNTLDAEQVIELIVSMRSTLGDQEFADMLAKYEALFYPALSQYGFQGGWVKSSDYIRDFDKAIAKHPKHRHRLPRASPPPKLDYVPNSAPTMSAVEPGTVFRTQSVYQEFQSKMDTLEAAGPAVVLAAPILAVRGEARANQFMANAAPVGGVMQAMGGTYEAKAAMPYNEEVHNEDRIAPVAQPGQGKTASGPVAPVTPAVAETPTVQAKPTATTPAAASKPAIAAQNPAGPSFGDVGKAARQAPGYRITEADPTRRRNQYPDFEPVPDNLLARAANAAQVLSGQLGEPIPADRLLLAPWVGRPHNARGERMSSGTSEGHLRNAYRYWQAFQQHFPADYALLTPDHEVTAAFAQAWGWSQATVGQKLIHHHIDNGNLVAPVPEGPHRNPPDPANRPIHARVGYPSEP